MSGAGEARALANRQRIALTRVLRAAAAACGLLALLTFALILAEPLRAQDDEQPVLVGTVFKVTDGDTIKVQLASGPINVRLDSIDAPESNQPHGAQARAALAKLVANKEVALEVITQDRYERLVAQVLLGDTSVNAQLVADGHAWAYRRYLKERNYCALEAAARRARRGLWAAAPTSWIYPSEWRKLRRNPRDRPTDYSAETVEGCLAALSRR